MILLEGLVRAEEVTLGHLAHEAGYALAEGERIVVSGVFEDSRECGPGALFVAIRGTREDGAAHARDAVARGAVAVAAERDPRAGVPWLRVPDAHLAAGRLADLVYAHPSRTLPLVGVTGTNGKTTTAHLLAQILPGQIGFLGTTGIRYPGVRLESANTTPGATAMRRHLGAMARAGCDACVAEVSSHALVQRRVDGLRFAAAVYTNLSGDHLDYHQTMEAYAAAKARLFAFLGPGATAVLNAKDPACGRIRTAARVVRFQARRIGVDAYGTRFFWRDRPVRIPLVGRHNAENAAAALEAACALGADPEEALALLERALPARGRLEIVKRKPFLVAVDYAHTDDALRRALEALREVTRGQILVVFGCGGDRDRSKRPRMGAVAARGADRIFVTNDNPRSEDPRAIAAEIVGGLNGRKAVVLLDRRRAIQAALSLARPGDAVLIAGKGHETYQVIGHRALPFDDVAVAGELLAASNP